MEKRHQKKFHSRAEAVQFINDLVKKVPSRLGTAKKDKIASWHADLSTALSYLERLGIPDEVVRAKAVKLRLKDELQRRRQSPVKPAQWAAE